MRTSLRITFSLLALCLLGGAVYLTVTLISPPAPLPVDAPPSVFSAARAMHDLEGIAREPHPIGQFPAHAAVRDHLLGKIRALGLEPEVQNTFGLRLVHPGFLLGGPVENVLVRLPGTDPEGAILLIAHYDSTPGAPGAADNGAGVVTNLETLRALTAAPALRHDVIFLFTDGHEPGIIGTHAFVAQHPWSDSVKLVVNLDGIKDGPPVLAHNRLGNDPWIPLLARTADRPGHISLPTHLFPAGENDLIPFNHVGVQGISFGTGVSAQEFHTMLDRPEIVNPGTVQAAGNQILALLRYLGDRPTLDIDAPEQTFFPVLGGLIHYPTAWAILLAVAAALCFLATLFYGFRKQELTWKGMGLGLLTWLLSVVLGVGISSLLWLGLQAIHPDYQYSPVRPHLSDDHLYAVGFIVLALAVATGLMALARRRITALDLAAGAWVAWLPVTIAATIVVPATSYLATWVLLCGSLSLLLALAVRSREGGWFISGLGFLICAILATFLWVPVIYIAFIGPGLTMPWLVIGLAVLWLGAMLPALDCITASGRRLFPAAAAVTAIGLLIAGNIVVGRDSPPPLVNSIGYWLDAESREACWIAFIGGFRLDARTTADRQVAFPEAMDERQSQLLVDPVRQPYRQFFPEAPSFSVLTSEAPLLAAEGPHLEGITDQWVEDRRVVQAKVTTSMHDRVYVIVPEESPLLAITVPDNASVSLPECDDGWMLRFDGTPADGIDMRFEFATPDPIELLLVEEKTGLPYFPGLATQPQPGTMRSPGEFLQGDATDFTAINRNFVLQRLHRE